MADKERAEAAVIADYLPEQLSDEEIVALVTAAIEQTGSAGEGMKAMGKVMGVVQPQVKGRADGGAVAAEVRRQLGPERVVARAQRPLPSAIAVAMAPAVASAVAALRPLGPLGRLAPTSRRHPRCRTG